MENLLKNLSSAARLLLYYLTPFQTINDLPNYIGDYWDLLKAEEEFAEGHFQEWEQIKQELIEVGVLQLVPGYTFYLRFSPSVLPFLRRYALTYGEDRWEKLEAIFILYYWRVSNRYLELLQSNDAYKRQAGIDSVKLELENFLYTLQILLKRQLIVLAPLQAITTYLYWSRDLQINLLYLSS